jgi:hypothetical protein
MAKRTILVDDIDGSEAGVETRRFSVGDQKYEIDLSPRNREALVDALRPFIACARRVGGPAGRSLRQPSAPAVVAESAAGAADDEDYCPPVPMMGREERDDIREWATAHGHDLKSRGRFPKSILDAYYADHAIGDGRRVGTG